MRPCIAFIAAGVLALPCRAQVKAPEFSLVSLDGDTVALSSLRGRVVVVDFWATWCAICRSSFPWLNGISRDMADKGVTVIGIDLEKVAKAKVAEVADKGKLAYKILLDPGMTTAKPYGIRGLPTMVVVDREGTVVGLFRGVEKNTRAEVEQLLARLAGDGGGARSDTASATTNPVNPRAGH